MRLDTCLSIAAQIVDKVETLGRKGTLGIMQDTASCMTSSLGTFFHKVCKLTVWADIRCSGAPR